MSDKPQVSIIAGPNGAGKTTFAREFLPNEASCPQFVNADLIAAGISPFAPEQAAQAAGRIMLARIVAHARCIPQWRAAGYEVNLWFLSLPDPETAIDRVRQRVREGRHDVPEDVICRRFDAGRRNFETVYRPLVDRWVLYDNSGAAPVVLSAGGFEEKS